MRALLAIARNEARRIYRNPFSVLALFVVVILPALYACLYLNSLWNPTSYMKNLPAALVVEDRGLGGSNYAQETVNRMMKRSGPHWIVMNRKQAEEGLAHHKLYMAVRFPEDFSESLTSLKTARPRQAVLDVRVDQGGSYIVSQLGAESLKILQTEIANTVRRQFNTTIISSIAEAQAGLTLASQKAGMLADGAQQITQGTRLIADKSGAAINGVQRLKGGMQQLDEGENRLAQGLTLAKNGSMLLADGLATMSEKVQAADNVPVMGWVLKNPLGFGRLQEGLGMAASKTAELSAAHDKLSNGAATIENGLKRSVEGAATLENGLTRLQGGLVKVSEGNQKAADGARLLSLKLGEASGRMKIKAPDKLVAVATDPVRLDMRMVNPVPNYGTGFAPFFVPLVLWIGAIAMFFMLEARDGKLNLSTASNPEITFGRFLIFGGIGVAQALTLSFSLQGFLGLQPLHPVWFVLTNVMLSLTFVACVQALIGLFSLAGRFIVLVLLLLQLTSSGGTFPLELCPPFFRAISPYLPLSYGVKLLRPVLSGGLTPMVLQECFTALFIILAIALGAMLMLLRRRAMLRELYETSPVF